MKKLKLLLFLAGAALLSGCVSQGRHQSELSSLRGHVVNLTNQVTRLDSALQNAEQTLTSERAEKLKLQSEVNRLGNQLAGIQDQKRRAAVKIEPSPQGIYRTPSGLELSSYEIQKALAGAGYYTGAIDGKIGPDTREAIRRFQADQSLTVDGVCGKATWERLRPHLDAIK